MAMLNILMGAAAAYSPAAAQATSVDPATPLPQAVRSVIEQAIESGDKSAIDAVVRYSIAAHPAAEAEIRLIHQEYLARLSERQAREAAEREQRLAHASMLERWDGSVELGASRFTGATNSLGLFAAVRAQRQGFDWAHRFSARAEIQETDGRRTAERLSAEWQPRLKLGERVYAFGISQFERDPFVGIDARYSAGLGAGYSLVDRDQLRVEVEAGASFRNTRLVEAGHRSTIAGRGSVDLDWQVSEQLELEQSGALFIDSGHSSGSATSAINAALFGPLRLRLSYELRFEKDTLRQLDVASTSSRATLVYDF